MKRQRILLLLVGLSWLNACTPSPKPIEYGVDKCAYCTMTIVDRQHAAEVVTDKGRVYKFDAIECMVNYLGQERETNFAFRLVNDFNAPGEWVDATTAQYLISPNLPSPMGAYLSAFATPEAAREMQAVKGGELFDWPALNRHLKKEGIVRFSEFE